MEEEYVFFEEEPVLTYKKSPELYEKTELDEAIENVQKMIDKLLQGPVPSDWQTTLTAFVNQKNYLTALRIRERVLGTEEKKPPFSRCSREEFTKLLVQLVIHGFVDPSCVRDADRIYDGEQKIIWLRTWDAAQRLHDRAVLYEIINPDYEDHWPIFAFNHFEKKGSKVPLKNTRTVVEGSKRYKGGKIARDKLDRIFETVFDPLKKEYMK